MASDTSSWDAQWNQLHPGQGPRPEGYHGEGGGSGMGGGKSPTDLAREMIQLQKEANQPAIQSLQAQQPEITSKYAQTRSQLQAKEPSLQERYKSLVDSIKGQGTQDVNQQTVITSNELGKRGITGSSTLAQQEIQNATSPLRQKYAGLEKDATLAGEDALTELRNQIANLTPQEVADQRAIANAIAQLQSGAASTGITQGLNLYSAQLQQQQAQEEAARQAEQQKFANQLAQIQSDREGQKLAYDMAKKPVASSGTGGNIASLMSLLGFGNVAGISTPTTPKPTYTPSPVAYSSQGAPYSPAIPSYFTPVR